VSLTRAPRKTRKIGPLFPCPPPAGEVGLEAAGCGPGTKLRWTARSLSGDKDLDSGEVTVDRSGLATFPGILVSKEGSRLILRPAR
jgi:hypothetical protein